MSRSELEVDFGLIRKLGLQLGEGGYSFVYAAQEITSGTHIGPEDRFAIKKVPPGWAPPPSPVFFGRGCGGGEGKMGFKV
jgi:hypothetical protein